MKTRYIAIVAVALAGILIEWTGANASARDFTYKARESRLIGHRDGTLRISDSGIAFSSGGGKEDRAWTFSDIKLLEILSSSKIVVRTYRDRAFPPGKDEEFTYKIVDGQLTKEASDFLRGRIPGPFVTALGKEAEQSEAEIPVKHLHRFGGCQGTLKVYKDFLVFESTTGHDSRSWRWTDIRSIGNPDPYRFEVLTHEPQTGGPSRSYNFELKESMPGHIYDQIWARVYRPALPTDQRETIGQRPAATQQAGNH